MALNIAAEQPESATAGVPVTDEEMMDILYKPQTGEWGDRGREQESARIIAGIEQFMTVGMFDFAIIIIYLIFFPSFCINIYYFVILARNFKDFIPHHVIPNPSDFC